MCDTCKEGDNNTKRSPAWPGLSVGSNRQCPNNKNLGPFQDHPQYSQGNNQEKLHMNKLQGRRVLKFVEWAKGFLTKP